MTRNAAPNITNSTSSSNSQESSTDLPLTAVDENQLVLERLGKLKTLKDTQAAGGAVAFPNDFKPADAHSRCTQRTTGHNPTPSRPNKSK